MDVILGWFWTGYWGSFWGWGPIRVKKMLEMSQKPVVGSKDIFVSSWLGTFMQQHGVLQVQCKAKWTQHHTNCPLKWKQKQMDCVNNTRTKSKAKKDPRTRLSQKRGVGCNRNFCCHPPQWKSTNSMQHLVFIYFCLYSRVFDNNKRQN